VKDITYMKPSQDEIKSLFKQVQYWNTSIEFNFENKKTQFLASVCLSVCELVCVTESGKERKLDNDMLSTCVCVDY